MTLDPTALLGWLIVGLTAGYIAAQVERGRGAGVVADMVVGGLGAMVAGHLAAALGLPGFTGRLVSFIAAGLGAAGLLAGLRIVAAARSRI